MKNQAKFTKSNKQGRMGVKISYCQYFCREIKKFQAAAWNPTEKTWFFNASDYEAVKALIAESFPTEGVEVVEINGTAYTVGGAEKTPFFWAGCEELGRNR